MAALCHENCSASLQSLNFLCNLAEVKHELQFPCFSPNIKRGWQPPRLCPVCERPVLGRHLHHSSDVRAGSCFYTNDRSFPCDATCAHENSKYFGSLRLKQPKCTLIWAGFPRLVYQGGAEGRGKAWRGSERGCSPVCLATELQ